MKTFNHHTRITQAPKYKWRNCLTTKEKSCAENIKFHYYRYGYKLIKDDLYNFRKCLVEIDFLMFLSIEFHRIGPVVLIALSAKTFLFHQVMIQYCFWIVQLIKNISHILANCWHVSYIKQGCEISALTWKSAFLKFPSNLISAHFIKIRVFSMSWFPRFYNAF